MTLLHMLIVHISSPLLLAGDGDTSALLLLLVLVLVSPVLNNPEFRHKHLTWRQI